MKLTELIQELQTIYDELGECDVLAHDEPIEIVESCEEDVEEINTVFIY